MNAIMAHGGLEGSLFFFREEFSGEIAVESSPSICVLDFIV